MAQREQLCACGREAIEVVSLASEDGILLIPVCAECAEDPLGGEQGELFRTSPRRPLTAMPPREAHAQEELPLEEDEKRGAA